MTIWRETRWAAGILTMVALALAIPGSLISQAHSFDVASSVTIHWDGDAFKGDVDSQRQSCEGGRRVNLFRVRPGSDRLVDSDTTNDNGRWRVEASSPSGHFYARVARRETEGYGHSHICRGATSRTIAVQTIGVG